MKTALERRCRYRLSAAPRPVWPAVCGSVRNRGTGVGPRHEATSLKYELRTCTFLSRRGAVHFLRTHDPRHDEAGGGSPGFPVSQSRAAREAALLLTDDELQARRVGNVRVDVLTRRFSDPALLARLSATA